MASLTWVNNRNPQPVLTVRRFLFPNARYTLAAAVTIVGAFASNEERLPGNDGRIIDPRFFTERQRLGIVVRFSGPRALDRDHVV